MGFVFSGEKVKQKRKEKGWTLKDLGEKIGVTESQISYIESGSRFPSAPRLGQLAEALGVTPNYFYERREEEEGKTVDT